MPDLWMDVDTALAEVPVNIFPLIDDTDFKSIEGAVAYNAAGMALRWHFVTTGGAYTVTSVTPTTGGAYDWTDQGDSGIYTIEIPASGGASINNDTEGFGWFTGVATGVLPWRGPTIGFRAAALNNSMIDGTTIDVNVTAMANGVVTAAAVATGAIDADAIADNAIDAGSVAASALNGKGDWNVGKTGYALSAGGVQAIWDALTSALTTVGSIGKLIVDNLNAAISSRSSHSAADVWAVATRVLTAGTNIALAKGTGVTGFNDLDAAGVRSAVGMASANLDTQLGDLPTAAENADAVWDEAISGHLTAGSTGNALNAAGSAGDPWSTPLPGAYGSGTAGKIIGDNLNATVSSRATQTSVDTIDDLLDTEVGALTTELAKVPKSDGTATWNATALASINAEADTALSDYGALKPTTAGRTLDVTATGAAGVDWGNVENKTTENILSATSVLVSSVAYVPASAIAFPTQDETLDDVLPRIEREIKLIARKDAAIATDYSTTLAAINADAGSGAGSYDNTTDSVEALRDRGDAAWTTATGFSTLDAAGVRSAVGLASANLDTQIGDVPTNAELTTALGTADDAVLAAIAALNNISSAQVTAAVPTAVQNAAAVLAAATANPIDANVQEINDVAVTGNGVSPKFGVT